MPKTDLPPVDTWALVSEGIEGPLRAGFRRGVKHSDLVITDEEIERICEAQHNYLMNWFSDTFRFTHGSDPDEEDV